MYINEFLTETREAEDNSEEMYNELSERAKTILKGIWRDNSMFCSPLEVCRIKLEGRTSSSEYFALREVEIYLINN